MAKYMTEQRRELISFLRSNPDKQFSAKEIAEYLRDSQISLSAVYRNLLALEEDGYITRVVREGSRESFYQCLDSDSCRDSIHLSCTSCGKTFHMSANEANRMLRGVSKNDGFQINKIKTILYGTCKNCI